MKTLAPMHTSASDIEKERECERNIADLHL